MRIPSVLAIAIPLLLLSACAPPEPDDFPEPPASPSPTESEIVGGVAIDLPADGLIGIHATLTALNGAVMDLTMIVHQSVPSTDAAAAVAATEAWCAGEMDAQILADQGYTLTAVDVTATLQSGDWPAEGASVLLYPIPWERAVLTASGDLQQLDTAGEGDYTPHCITPVTLDGPGTGTILVGIPGDTDGDSDGTPPLGGWSHNLYGADATHLDGVLRDVMFSNCFAEVSDLGASLGAGSTPGWKEYFDDPTLCYLGSFGSG